MERPYEFLSRTGDGACVVDRGQRIVLWNEAATRLLGFAAEEVLGLPCYRVLGGTDESGCTVCERGCVTSRAVRRDEAVPARDVHVRTRDAGRIRVNVSTIAMPSDWHDLSVLAHLFRPVGARTSRESVGVPRPDPWMERGTPEVMARARPTKPVDGLTRREHDVLRLLSTGASTGSICARLGIATTTTRAHVRSILGKLGVRDRLEAVTFSLREGLLEIPRSDATPPDR